MTTTKMLKQIIVLITSFRAYEWHRLSSIRIILSLKDISLVACRLRWKVEHSGQTFLVLFRKFAFTTYSFDQYLGNCPPTPPLTQLPRYWYWSINFSYPVQRHEMETFSSRFYLQYHEYHVYQAEIPKSCIYFCISCCIGLLVLLLQVIGSIDHWRTVFL